MIQQQMSGITKQFRLNQDEADDEVEGEEDDEAVEGGTVSVKALMQETQR